MKNTAFSSLIAALPVVYGAIDGIIAQTPAPAAVAAPSGPSPTTTPPPVLFVQAGQMTEGVAGTAAENYIPGVDCAVPGRGAQPGVFQPYLAAHRGQQQVCPYDPTQNIRYRVDYKGEGCCTESATLTRGPGGLGCCPCGSICNQGFQQMQDWYWLNGNQLVVTNALGQGFGGVFGKKAEPTGVPALDLSALANVTDVKHLDLRADKASDASKASAYIPGQNNGGGYPTQPIQFQPTGQTQICYSQGLGNNCQQIYYGYNTATTIVNGGFNQGVGGQGDPGVPLCNTYYNGGGIPTSSCSIVGAPLGNVGGIGGGCQTSYFGGVQTTNCIQGGALGGYGAPYLPCFTYFNGGQQTVTCTPTTTASTYFTTSTQSFCNTFVNGGATTTSCTTNFYTSATRTSYSIINAAAKETGMPGGVLGQGVAAVLGIAAMVAL